jgi:hypothetical protein
MLMAMSLFCSLPFHSVPVLLPVCVWREQAARNLLVRANFVTPDDAKEAGIG